MSETGLPPGWSIKVSRTHQRPYYYNQGTKEATWEAPFGADKDKVEKYIQEFTRHGNKPLVGSDGKIRVSHLLVKHEHSRKPKSWKLPDGITRTRDEAIQILKRHREAILNGEVKLAELVATESDCSSHSQGGDLGFFGRGQMQPSFEEAAFALNVGELSDVVESDSGVHLIFRTA